MVSNCNTHSCALRSCAHHINTLLFLLPLFRHLGYFKWEYTPTFRGFNSFLGYYEGAEDYFTHTRSGAYDLHLERSARCGAGCSLVPDRRGEYSVNVFSDEAVRVIEQGRDQLKPWFLYLAWQSIHSPHQAPQAYLDLYNASMPGRTVAAMLSALDDGVANVTAALNRTGQTDNTLIIFTSGEAALLCRAVAPSRCRFSPCAAVVLIPSSLSLFPCVSHA